MTPRPASRLPRLVPVAGCALIALATGLALVRGEMDAAALALVGLGFVLCLALFVRIERAQLRALLRLGLVAALLLGNATLLYLLLANHPVEWDLTRNGLHSLAPQTVKLLRNLQQPVEVEVLSSAREPYAGYLQKYAALNPRFRFRIVNPYRAARLATRPGETAQMNEIRVRCADREKNIAFDAGADLRLIERKLERQIVNALLSVLRDRKPRLYFVRGHGEKSIEYVPADQQSARSLFKFAEFLYKSGMEVRALDLRTENLVPGDCDALVIAGPQSDYLESELAALRSHLARGGGLFALLDPPLSAPARLPRLRALLADAGAEVGEDIVVDYGSYASNQNSFVPLLRKFNPMHPVTENMQALGEDMAMPLACTVRRSAAAPASLQVSELLLSSEKSWTVPLASYIRIAQDQKMTLPTADTWKALPLGVAVSAPPGRGAPGAAAGTRLIVLGDSDFLSNAHLGNVQASLGFFALGWLSGQNDLLEIPAREVEQTPLQLTPRQQNLISILSVVAAPFALFFGGLAYTAIRRRRR